MERRASRASRSRCHDESRDRRHFPNRRSHRRRKTHETSIPVYRTQKRKNARERETIAAPTIAAQHTRTSLSHALLNADSFTLSRAAESKRLCAERDYSNWGACRRGSGADLPLSSVPCAWKGPKAVGTRSHGPALMHGRFRKINAGDAIVKCVIGDTEIQSRERGSVTVGSVPAVSCMC